MGKHRVKSCFFENDLGQRAHLRKGSNLRQYGGVRRDGKMTPIKTVQKKNPLSAGHFGQKVIKKVLFFSQNAL